jgi:hypothetical protein
MKLRHLPLFLLTMVAVSAPIIAAGQPYATELSGAWQTRLARLAEPKTLVSEFTESRYTPFKKTPVRVHGTVRIERTRGLSLDYNDPHAPLVILDDQGLLLRHKDGREQSAPPEAESGMRLLHALLTFDLATLENAYSVAANGDPAGDWSLVFTRKDGIDAPYKELALEGKADLLTGIRLAKTDKARIEIAVEKPQIDAVFTPADLQRYFR